MVRLRSLPPSRWHEADRDAWERACMPSCRLTPGGAGAHLSEHTKKGLQRVYGLFLAFCVDRGLLIESNEPCSGLRPDVVQLFLEDRHLTIGSVTQAIYLDRLYRMLRLLSSTTKANWLHDLWLDARGDARPRAKFNRLVTTDRLRHAGLNLIAQAERRLDRTPLQRAVMIRNGLMVALLAHIPIRLGCFYALRIGKDILRLEDGWWIILNGSQTKNRHRDPRPIPPRLTPLLDTWVDEWRGAFLDPQDFLWPAIKGGGIAYTYAGTIITNTTFQEVGVAISPHLFRDCAVCTIGVAAPEQMGIAPALLHHRDPRTTDQHYNRGHSHAAIRRFQDVIATDGSADEMGGVTAPFQKGAVLDPRRAISRDDPHSAAHNSAETVTPTVRLIT